MSNRNNEAPPGPLPAEPNRIERCQPLEALPEFLTPDEFREYVGIGRSTVYDLLRRNEIPHVRFGRCIRIPKAALQLLVPAVK